MIPPGMFLEQFEVSGSHYEVGFAIGERFAAQIHQSLDNYHFFQEALLPYHRSPEGQATYEAFFDLNRERYPDYVAELEGLARGAERSFEELFLLNLRGDYRGYLREEESGSCSDCAVVTDKAALIGHNEDGSPAFRGNMYLVHAKIEGKPAFGALTYPGFLCGNAFGFNAEGVCFSIDNVRPRDIRVGVGRHFIARSLLDAQSLDDATQRATVPQRAAGFSYTIGSVGERRVVIVEVAPASHHVREVRGAYFHANHYLELPEVDQHIDASSQARVERAGAILEERSAQNAGDVLTILADQADEQFPIRRSATPPDASTTLCTALFDLDARELRIYTDHPIQAPAAAIRLAI